MPDPAEPASDQPSPILVLFRPEAPAGTGALVEAMQQNCDEAQVEVVTSLEAAPAAPALVLVPMPEPEAGIVAGVRRHFPGVPIVLLLPEPPSPAGWLEATHAAGAHDYLTVADREPRTICRVLHSAPFHLRSERLQNRYQVLLERNPDGFWINDLEGRLREVNPAFCAMVGYSREELLGMTISDLELQEDAAATAAHIRQILEAGSDRFETRHRHREGRVVHFDVSAHLLGEGEGLIMAIFRDITDQRDAQRQIQEKTRQLTAVLETAGDAIITADSHGRIRYFNPAAEVMFGRSAEAMEGRKLNQLMPEPHASEHDDYILRYERDGDPRVIGQGRELEACRADGSTFPIELNVTDTGLEDPPLYVGIIRDISERKATEAELRRLATTDPLTGLPNRRYFLERAEAECRRAARYDRPFSLIMLDVDHFKQVNDHHGHNVGDAVLRALAGTLSHGLRDEALVGRLGGEEFAVLLPEATAEEAVAAAERIRRRIAAKPVATEAGELTVTASLGVATWQRPAETVDGLLSRADAALYKSKESGRDRVTRA